MASTTAQTRKDVDNMSVKDRLWDSLSFAYGTKTENSNKSYDQAYSQADRGLLKRGMQRSSYGGQTLANINQQKITAANQIESEKIADYENRLYQLERDEAADAQWQQQFEEGQRQFNENMAYQQDRAKASDTQWQQQFDYTKARDAVADNQWNLNFNYQQERDKVGDSQWQKQFDEGVRQFDEQLAFNKEQANKSSTSGGGGSTGKPKTDNGLKDYSSGYLDDIWDQFVGDTTGGGGDFWQRVGNNAVTAANNTNSTSITNRINRILGR